MIIKTKFKKDSKVYWIEKDVIKEGIVYSGYIMFRDTYNIYYYVKINDEMLENPIKEELLYRSKDDLKKGL